jgi:hypothetical protein
MIKWETSAPWTRVLLPCWWDKNEANFWILISLFYLKIKIKYKLHSSFPVFFFNLVSFFCSSFSSRKTLMLSSCLLRFLLTVGVFQYIVFDGLYCLSTKTFPQNFYVMVKCTYIKFTILTILNMRYNGIKCNHNVMQASPAYISIILFIM